ASDALHTLCNILLVGKITQFLCHARKNGRTTVNPGHRLICKSNCGKFRYNSLEKSLLTKIYKEHHGNRFYNLCGYIFNSYTTDCQIQIIGCRKKIVTKC
ncbi:hypothetical protein L9F63_023650, partial [Diploptera punctata]